MALPMTDQKVMQIFPQKPEKGAIILMLHP